MATLSLREIAESQLGDTPIIDGQLVCCLDTGRFYRDTGSSRIELEVDIICVSSLPLAPITDRFYLVRPDELYFYDGAEWYPLTHTHLNKDILDKIEVALTEELASNYEEGYLHSQEPHAPVDAEANIIETVQKNGADLPVTDKTVNVSVPTKVSELENDEGFVNTDTTYTLETNKAAENGNVELYLMDNNGHSDVVSVQGAGLTAVTTDDNGVMIIRTDEPEQDGMYAEAPYDKGPAIRVVLEDGDSSEEMTYYIPFLSESDSSLLGNDGIIYKTYTSEYDADARAILGTGILGKMRLGSNGWEDGYGLLVLGNDIESGTGGNKYGAIQIFSATSNYWTIYGDKSISEDYVLFMPRNSGCLVVTPDDIQTGNETTPIYITADGMAMAFDETIGASNQPVYMNRGAITAMDEPLSIFYGGTGTNIGHIEVEIEEDTDSYQNPDAGENFTVIDELARDEFGHVTTLNTKTITLPFSSFGDTKVTQELTSSSSSFPLLLAPSGQAATETTTAYFGTAFQAIPSDGTLIATTFVGQLSGNAETATTAETAESANTLGNLAVGSGINPIYFVGGIPEASAETVGDTAQPVYLKDGEITTISDTVGNANLPVYLSNGKITAMTGVLDIKYGGTGSQFGHIAITLKDDTVSTDRLILGENNSFTVVDSVTRDEYGHVTTINVKTIYMPNETAGSGVNPIYFSDGVPVASTSTVGSPIQPTWLNAGTITAMAGPLDALYGGTGTTTGHCIIDLETNTTTAETIALNDIFRALTSVTRDEYGHVLSTATTTYTLSPNIPLTLTQPETETDYYIPFSEGSDTVLRYNDGITYKTYTSEYDADARAILGTGILGKMRLGSNGWEDGYGLLVLGNNIESGIGGNKYGAIQLFSATSNYWTLYGGKSISENYVLFMPRSSGCLVVTPDDIQTGNETTPIYIASDGMAMEFDETIGASNLPVYMNHGAITAMTGVLDIQYGGTGSQFGHVAIDLKSDTDSTDRLILGEANSFTVVDSITRDEYGHTTAINVKEIYMPNANAGSGINPIYFSDGAPIASSSTVGGATQPVFLNSGTITALTNTIGSSTQFIYMDAGAITASTSSAGGTARGVYLNDGVITALSSTVGSGVIPVYMSSGTITASSSTVGSGTQPVFLNSGTITACGDIYTAITNAEIDALF